MSKQISVGYFDITGRSIASIETFFYIKKFKLGIDAGWRADEIFKNNVDNLFISHLHPDHWDGILHILFRNYLLKRKITFLVYNRIFEQFLNILNSFQNNIGISFDFDVTPVDVKSDFILDENFYLSFYEMDHSKPTLGLILFNNNKPIFAYTSDTSINGVLENPIFCESEVLFIESTFLDKQDYDKAIEHKHIHIKQIADNLDKFNNKKIYLIHISPRYSEEERIFWFNFYFGDKKNKNIKIL